MLLKNQWITEEIKEKIKKPNKTRDKRKQKQDDLKPMRCSKSILRRKFIAM